ncbi:MAG TPA: hypothetical protein VFE37_08440 [Chloroflexota bacterium]|nr:hypothetical protein [Chloroflexota bacterium]
MWRVATVSLLVVLVASLAPPARAQELDFTTVVLTESEVPSGLRLSQGRSGPQTRDGARAYEVTFEADPSRVGPGSGGIIVVTNLVALPADPVAALDEMTRSAKQSMPGSPTDAAPPAVGDESRAFTSSGGVGPFSVTVAAAMFRRNRAVAGVVVMSAGGQPQMDEAVRLAQLVDGRLAEAAR